MVGAVVACLCFRVFLYIVKKPKIKGQRETILLIIFGAVLQSL